MRSTQSGRLRQAFAVLSVALLFSTSLAGVGNAQRARRAVDTIAAGTTIAVRTNQTIDTNDANGQVYTGTTDQDVLGRNGIVVIPRGSDVEMVVRRTTNNDLALDLDSVTVNGQRYGVQTDENVVNAQRREGIGANQRTAKYLGGGALLGAVIGAIAGGGKGAAIGAGAGAAAGAGVQIFTRGKSIEVPAESLLTFRLSEPIQTGVYDQGYMRNGVHYHPTAVNGDISTNSPAYRQGLRTGRSDQERGQSANAYTTRWSSAQDRRDYEAGYNDGYYRNSGYYNGNNTTRQKPGYSNYPNGYPGGSIRIGSDHNIRWQGVENSRIYVRVDNERQKLFASGQSGTQAAPWMTPGHIYTFIMQDAYGNELGRDTLDLR